MSTNQIASKRKDGFKYAFGIWWVQLEDGKYYIYQSKETKKIFGHSQDNQKREIFSEGWLKIANKVIQMDESYAEYVWGVRDSFTKLIDGECESYANNFPWLGQNGELIWIENHLLTVRKENGVPTLIVGSSIDITEQMDMTLSMSKLEEANKQLLRAYELAVKSGKVMIWYIDAVKMKDGYYFGNDMHVSKLGITLQENGLFLMQDFHDSIYIDDEEGKNLFDIYQNLKNQTKIGLNSFEKIIVKHQNMKTKEIMYLEHNFEVETRSDKGMLLVRGGFMTDVTDEVQYQKRNEYLMKYDAMTDLLNRNSFEKYIVSAQMKKKYGLIVIDIDGLKFINDAFGHIMGDKAIKFTASKLKEQFASSSEIFRIGGDEYTVISDILEYDLLEHKIESVKKSFIEFYSSNNININISSGIEVVKDNTDFSEAFIDAENLMYRRKLNERSSRKSRTMETVLETLNQKTEETRAHCQRMGDYAVRLMKKSGYHRASDFEDMRLLCKVHDIGKITVSEDILSKPGKLTKEEYMKIRSHAEAGYKIVRNIVDSEDIANGVLYHHEKVDGSGYPFGLTGDEIPDFAKIVSICDAFDVMISGRPYSRPKQMKEVLKELKMNAGTQFDKKLVYLFIDMIQKEKL